MPEQKNSKCFRLVSRYAQHVDRAVFATLVVMITTVVGCTGAGGDAATPSRDPEQESLAEYDIARNLWLQKQQPRQALEHALKAFDLDDRNEEAAHLIALIYLNFCQTSPLECRLDEAEQYARKALALKADYREARNTLGVILIHARKYDEAIAVLTPLSRDILYQTPEIAWGNLGWAYLEKGETDRAIEALQRSIAAQPRFCVGQYRLGLAYEKKKDPQAAVVAYSRALDAADPACQGMQDAYQHRALALVKLGRHDDARDDLERCVQLDKSTDAGRQCSALLAKLK